MRFHAAVILMILSTPAFAGQRVVATWYGSELAGNRTASGERFDPNGLTAAHRSVAVRVNDRGPFTKGVSLDLSHGAARAIGMRVTQSVTVDKC